MKDLTHHGEVEITYLMKKSVNPSPFLVVAFPGAGDNATGNYGYVYTIAEYDVNAVFIKQSGNYNNSFFTCKNGDFKIERTIKELVDKIASENSCSQIIAVGSSMGGFDALYYGLKYDWNIIAGSPVWHFGADRVFYMFGASGTYETKQANSLLPNAVKGAGEREFSKKLYVSWGEGEGEWKNAANGPQLLKHLDEAGIKYDTQLFPYSDHISIHWLFPNVIKQQLGLFLGNDVQSPESDEPPELKCQNIRKKLFAKIIPLVDTLNDTPANTAIKGRVQYGDGNIDNALRYFVFGMQGYYLFIDWNRPFAAKLSSSKAYWSEYPFNKLDSVLSFYYQQTVLNYYTHSQDQTALLHIEEQMRTYFDSVAATARATDTYKHWWNSTRRMHFFLNYLCVAERNDENADLHDKSRGEILYALRRFTEIDVRPTDVWGVYRQSLALLHLAKLYSENSEFADLAFNAAIDNANAITEFHVNSDGVVIFEQVRIQHIVAECLGWHILKFVDANGFAETKALKKLRKTNTKIQEAASHFVRPDGVRSALGHTMYDKPNAAIIPRAKGNFIRQYSNIAILNDCNDLAYITVNSGQNNHANLKHCDLLSFTFWYDGQQLILDSEGGNGKLAEFAQSAVAHSAFFADEKDYVSPSYFDWTTIDSVDEQDDYVLLCMSHRLINGLRLCRNLMWVKPNVIILHDVALSEDEHNYTQNFILPDLPADSADSAKVSLKSGKVKLTISQLNGTAELKQFRGTTDVDAPKEAMRGSLISNWNKLRKGLNLAYARQGAREEFLTIVEATSGAAGEVSVKTVYARHRKITVELTDGRIIEAEEYSDDV